MNSKRLIFYFTTIFCSFFSLNSNAQQSYPQLDENGIAESCTSIMVGRKATTDGSVITSHSCDSNYRTWLNIVAHKKNKPDSKMKIYWGTLHTESVFDSTTMINKGEIPDVDETFAYLNTAYPCLNEKQLGIGETTITGKKELVNPKGLFMIEELEKIILQRCTNARDAIRLIGNLVKQYGYADWGECITIADKREVWQLEIFGGGPDEIGSVWAAQRIPDDHVGISANIPRIGLLDLKDTDHFMASENVTTLAQKMGWWDGKDPFKFWKAYSGGKPFGIREFFVLSSVAPSLQLKFEADELPFSVKPDNKISVRDVMRFYRTTYEGSPYDMTKNLTVTQKSKNDKGETIDEKIMSPVANPFLTTDTRNLLNELKPGAVERQRTIAVPQCSYSHIIQLRDWLPDEIGGIAWFSFDNPEESPRFPIFAGNLTLPTSFNICMQHRFREDAAGWWFRKANKLATVRWGIGRTYIEEGVTEFENKAFEELPMIQKRALELYKDKEMGAKELKYKEFLTTYTNHFAYSAMYKWNEISETLWALFARGF